jgi:hypothetical protein
MFANKPFFFNEVIKLSQKQNDNIEWGVIYPRANWKYTSINLVKTENYFYLYDDFEEIYKNIDIFDTEYKSNFDNIYKITESSKRYFKKLDSEEQLKSAFAIYKIYKNFLEKNKPDAILFPDLEVVDGLILLNICKELNIEILYAVHTRNLGKSFFARDYYDSLPEYFGNYENKDKKLAKEFLENYLNSSISPKNLSLEKSEEIKIEIPNIFNRYINSLKNNKLESYHIEKTDFILRIKMNIVPLVEVWRRFIFKNHKINYFHIKTEKDRVPKNYIIFPLQVTPESSINTLEQYFIDQERIVDLIRLNMPNNYFLLLKEHPSMIGIRENSFYKRLRKKSGVLLVSPHLNTEEFVKKSKLVITVTGTIGLESYIKNKPILMFGPTFFSNFVDEFNSYKDLRKQIDNLVNKSNFDSKEQKIENIAKLYNISYEFIVHEPFHFPQVMEKNNIKNYLEAVKDHINRLKGN